MSSALIITADGAKLLDGDGTPVRMSADMRALLVRLDEAGDVGAHVEPDDAAKSLDRLGLIIRRTFSDIGRAHITLAGCLYLDATEV